MRSSGRYTTTPHPPVVDGELHRSAIESEVRQPFARAVELTGEVRRNAFDERERTQARALHLCLRIRVRQDLRFSREHRVAERVVDVMMRVDQPRDAPVAYS
jgi:hypothetical protein